LKKRVTSKVRSDSSARVADAAARGRRPSGRAGHRRSSSGRPPGRRGCRARSSRRHGSREVHYGPDRSTPEREVRVPGHDGADATVSGAAVVSAGTRRA
jgi:hypothetical protein